MPNPKIESYARGIALLAATLWVGGTWAVGYLAAPVLFHALPDNKQLAGQLAGQMFAVIAYIGVGSAIALLAFLMAAFGRAALRQPVFWIVAAMFLLVLAGQFGIQPVMADLKSQALPADVMHSPFADRFKALHGAASILYLVQSVLGALLILKIRRN